jgi:hypothetical protein
MLLRAVAERVRRAIEKIPPGQRGSSLRLFPSGTCGDASLLLGAFLADQGVAGFEYVCGERGSKQEDTWTSHAWLRRGPLVIDITADQFADAPAAVIVESPSVWHEESFRIGSTPEPADFRAYRGPDVLHVIYARMLEHLSPL